MVRTARGCALDISRYQAQWGSLFAGPVPFNLQMRCSIPAFPSMVPGTTKNRAPGIRSLLQQYLAAAACTAPLPGTYKSPVALLLISSQTIVLPVNLFSGDVVQWQNSKGL